MPLRKLALLACLSAAVAAQSATEWAERALQAQQAGRLEEAEQAWQKAIPALEQSGDKAALARGHLFRGLFWFDRKRYEDAGASLQRARQLFIETRNDQGLALTEVQLGEVERLRGRQAEAESHLRAGLSVAERTGDQARKLEALSLLGKLLDGAQRWPEATEVYHEVARLQRTSGSTRLGETLLTLAALHQMQDLNRQALDIYAEAARLPATRAEALSRTAALHLRLGQFEPALQTYVLLGGDNPAHAANRAYCLERLGRTQEARAAYEQWLQQNPEHKDAGSVRQRLLALGARLELPEDPAERARVLGELNRWDEAESTLQEALAGAAPERVPALANQLGLLQLRRGQREKARASFRRGLQAAPEHSSLLLNLSETYLAAGDSEQAIPLIERSLQQMRRENAGPLQLATALNNLAAAQQNLGRWEQSLIPLREAEELSLKFARPDPLQGTLLNLAGYGYARLGRSEEALSYYRRALAIRRAQQDHRGEVITLLNMGAVLGAKGKPLLLEARQLNERVGDAELGVTLENNLARLETDPRKAREGYLRALAGVSDNPLLRGTILASLSQVEAGTAAERRAYADEAFGLLQSVGAREPLFVLLPFYAARDLPLPDGRPAHRRMLELLDELLRGLPVRSAGAFIEQHRSEVETAGAAAFRSGNPAELLECEEAVRALAVLGMTRSLELTSSLVPRPLAERSRTLNARLEQLLRLPPSREVNEDLRRLKLELGLLNDELERLHLSSGYLQQARAVPLGEVQKLLRAEEALLEYVRLPDRWAVVLVTSAQARVIDLGPRAPLEAALRAARSALETPAIAAEPALSAAAERVWQPLSGHLSGIRRLVVVPTGPLYALPLAALPHQGQPLIAHLQIENASSATAWALSRRQRSQGRGSLAAALGNLHPPAQSGLREDLGALPATLKEVEVLARWVPSTRVLRERQMTVAQLEQGSRSTNLLHFATHGVLDGQQPLLGGLVAADGMVRVADVFGWTLQAQLVVLSACNTGRLSDGQEWVGLTRAFQHAGARTLLASLWAVSDQATAEWMSHFYAGLGQGEAISSAVQRACLRTRARYPHPSHWAAFLLWGDGDFGLVRD